MVCHFTRRSAWTLDCFALRARNDGKKHAMSVTIVFLGPLRDLAGVPQVEYPAPLDWEGLLAAVPAAVAEQLREPRVHVACAGKVLSDKTGLAAQDGDEVALLPPVSGG